MKIIAHRGYSSHFAENTPASWDAALTAGAYAIETDIRWSLDGIGVCAHDEDLVRLFGRSEKVGDLTQAELTSLSNADGAQISLLSDALAYAREGHGLLLDLKDESPAALERTWLAIAEAVPEARRHLVIVGCHSLGAVGFFMSRGPSILGFIPAAEAAEAFWEAGARLIRLWEGDVSAVSVQRLRALGAEVWVTSGGHGTTFSGGDHSGTDLSQMMVMGVGGVLVNDVASAVQFIKSRSNA